MPRKKKAEMKSWIVRVRDDSTGESRLSDDTEQQTLFDLPADWEAQWSGVPLDYEQNDVQPVDSINVQFRSDEDRRRFLVMLGEQPGRRKSVWWPKMEYLRQSVTNAPSTQVEQGQYPVYVISKGRSTWGQRLTVRALDKLGIKHLIVIEPQEYDQYAAVTSSHGKLVMLPFSNLGQGSIPARNWVWEHAASTGADRHWILDDNMDGFYRMHENLKRKVTDFNPFVPVEAFADRYLNIALAGMNYEFFADRRRRVAPFNLNTRIYSCILIKNDLPYRWRGRYNEDTDLSLRALKDGWCTCLFNAVLVKKMPTMTMTGGNTDELYKEDGRLKMAESLRDQHPDVVTVTEKWGRPQHHVNYKMFRVNRLIPREGVVIPEGEQDYGMSLDVDRAPGEEEVFDGEEDSRLLPL